MEVPEVSYADAQGVRIAWQQWGSGPDVLAVPPLVVGVVPLVQEQANARAVPTATASRTPRPSRRERMIPAPSHGGSRSVTVHREPCEYAVLRIHGSKVTSGGGAGCEGLKESDFRDSSESLRRLFGSSLRRCVSAV